MVQTHIMQDKHTHKHIQKHPLTHTHLTHTQPHTHTHTYSHKHTMKDTHTTTTHSFIPGQRNHVFDPASVFLSKETYILSKRDLQSKIPAKFQNAVIICQFPCPGMTLYRNDEKKVVVCVCVCVCACVYASLCVQMY